MIEFLDSKAAVKKLLKQFIDQEWIAEQALEIERLETKLEKSSGGSIVIPTGETFDREESLADSMDKLDIAKHRYSRASDYLKALAPCWDRLTDDERILLELRYVDCEPGGIQRIMKHFNIEQAQAYRRSDSALDRLARLMYNF